jgi:hypothetical protein
MIKREHIKQAIDEISRRSPEIGYSLDEMLGMGIIDLPPEAEGSHDRDNLYFVFDGQKVLVNRVLFFQEGTVPIEQGLLIKYGELLKKQEIQDHRSSISYKDAYQEIHKAGLRLAVTHEIDYAVSRLKKRKESAGGKGETYLIPFLESLKEEKGPPPGAGEGGDASPLYRGVVDVATPACFMPFRVCMENLMQVADMNVEFFHVRFVLNCLGRGLLKNLLTCTVDRNIEGLIYVSLREKFLKGDLEIKYLSTMRGKTWSPEETPPKPLRGVGTFLVAGVWILWKNEMPALREIVLDAETGARKFYDAVGFKPRGMAGYVLRSPKGYLLRSILSMAHGIEHLREDVIAEIQGIIKKQVKSLRKKPKNDRAVSERKATIAAIQECLKPSARPQFTEAAMSSLLKYETKIPESKEMIRYFSALSEKPAEVSGEHATGPCH